jgi:hypothetical protein
MDIRTQDCLDSIDEFALLATNKHIASQAEGLAKLLEAVTGRGFLSPDEQQGILNRLDSDREYLAYALEQIRQKIRELRERYQRPPGPADELIPRESQQRPVQ